jgi:serine/threonine protein kinase
MCGVCCRQFVLQEVDVLCGLNHPSLMCLCEYYVEGSHVYLITELLKGGELLDVVNSREFLPEAEAQAAFTSILQGIAHMHSR